MTGAHHRGHIESTPARLVRSWVFQCDRVVPVVVNSSGERVGMCFATPTCRCPCPQCRRYLCRVVVVVVPRHCHNNATCFWKKFDAPFIHPTLPTWPCTSPQSGHNRTVAIFPQASHKGARRFSFELCPNAMGLSDCLLIGQHYERGP
jgi:hypothetical protein